MYFFDWHLIILDVVKWSLRLGRVLGHHVEVHESTAAEKAEAAGTAKDTTHHVFRGLLQPMADGVFKFLIPHHESRP